VAAGLVLARPGLFPFRRPDDYRDARIHQARV